MTAEFLILAVLALLACAAAWDIASFTIPNFIPLTLVVLFASFAVAAQLPLGVVGSHLLVGLVGLVCLALALVACAAPPRAPAAAPPQASAISGPLAFPGAAGWAARTPGGHTTSASRRAIRADAGDDRTGPG